MSAIKVVATFTVKSDKAEEFVGTAKKLAEATLAEDGCNSFDFVKVNCIKVPTSSLGVTFIHDAQC